MLFRNIKEKSDGIEAISAFVCSAFMTVYNLHKSATNCAKIVHCIHERNIGLNCLEHVLGSSFCVARTWPSLKIDALESRDDTALALLALSRRIVSPQALSRL